MTTSTDSLARAIDSLGAVEVTARIEGDELDKARYAFSAGRWHTATPATLLDFERYDTDGAFPSREDAALRYERDYPEAMAEMPSWWTPTQQYATRYIRDVPRQEYVVYATPQEAHATIPVGALGTRCVVTVNLETGEEVSA